MKVRMNRKRKEKRSAKKGDKDVDREGEGPGSRVLICPHCNGTDIWYETGLITGYKYHCKSCDYIGAYIIQSEMPEARKRGNGPKDE